MRIRGSMDRVERDERGRAYVVDFKTGRQAPTRDEVARHAQLAVYQVAVREGAVDEVFGGRRPEPGGAELVHLRQPAPRGGRRRPAARPVPGAALAGVGGRPARHRRGPRPRRALHTRHRPALRHLRLPRLLQRPPRGPSHRGVSGVEGSGVERAAWSGAARSDRRGVSGDAGK